MPPSATNALDSAKNEWKDKSMAFVGYGGVGGARAIEQLRMAPLQRAVHIGLEPFLGVLTLGKALDDYPREVIADSSS